MAKAIASTVGKVKKVTGKGLQAKTKTSNNKTSKNYKKKYRGQGR